MGWCCMASTGRVRLMSTPAPSEPSLNPWTANFWSRLFDFTFRTFVTPQIISTIYVIGMMIILIATVFGVVEVLFTQGFWTFIWSLILSPVFLVVAVVILRVWMELLIVLFTIAGG